MKNICYIEKGKMEYRGGKLLFDNIIGSVGKLLEFSRHFIRILYKELLCLVPHGCVCVCVSLFTAA